jgi:hypothetical protein
MVFDVLALALLVAGVVVAGTGSVAARARAAVLPVEDLPPLGAPTHMPSRRRLPQYVDQGLAELDLFLGDAEPR